MYDQLIIGDKASFDDFGASLADWKEKQPKKKSIKDSVPFSNKTHDFSKIDGQLYWEERDLEYIFEMLADSPEELERMKNAFSDYVMNVMEEEIRNPFNPDYHYIATYDDMSYSDDEGKEKTAVTVKFTAYPYKVANTPTVFMGEAAAYGQKVISVMNNSSHPIAPEISTDGSVTLSLDSVTLNITGAGTFTDSNFMLKQGLNEITVINRYGTPRNVRIEFYEEVF